MLRVRPCGTIRYFRVYVYFCNLVIFRVIINTLVCDHILVIVKSLSCRFHGRKHISESRKIYLFSLFFFIPILSLHIYNNLHIRKQAKKEIKEKRRITFIYFSDVCINMG